IRMGGDDVNASTTIDHNALDAYIIDKDRDEQSGVGVIGLKGSDLSSFAKLGWSLGKWVK
ncbi:hypothetical protein KI387_021079, partial [Taxus chinensis]